LQEENKNNFTPRDTFGQRLRKLRVAKGLSQVQFASLIGYKRSGSISNIENDKTPPDIAILAKIAECLNVDLHELITSNPSHVVEDWKAENQTLLELLAKYISAETARLIDERHKFWGELGVAEEKAAKHIVGQDEYAQFLKGEINRIEKLLADTAEDQHYVQEALDGMQHR
jgi:transcriptional regulator with XRE-family HTH domain